MIDDEYYPSAQVAMYHDGMGKHRKAGSNNYNSPAQLREMGLSQQMVPN